MNRKAATLLLLGAIASAAHADLLEIAPDLYLLTRASHRSNESPIKMAAIREALDFAKSRGMVAIPISGRVFPADGIGQRTIYEYQFRLVSREAADSISICLGVLALECSAACTSTACSSKTPSSTASIDSKSPPPSIASSSFAKA